MAIDGTHKCQGKLPSYQGNKIVLTKGIINFTKYLFRSYRRAGIWDENDLLYSFERNMK